MKYNLINGHYLSLFMLLQGLYLSSKTIFPTRIFSAVRNFFKFSFIAVKAILVDFLGHLAETQAHENVHRLSAKARIVVLH